MVRRPTPRTGTTCGAPLGVEVDADDLDDLCGTCKPERLFKARSHPTNRAVQKSEQFKKSFEPMTFMHKDANDNRDTHIQNIKTYSEWHARENSNPKS